MVRWAAIGLVALVGAGVYTAKSPAAAQLRPPGPLSSRRFTAAEVRAIDRDNALQLVPRLKA